MKKKGKTRRSAGISGQVMVEFVIMAVMALLLVFALAVMARQIGYEGERMSRLVRLAVP